MKCQVFIFFRIIIKKIYIYFRMLSAAVLIAVLSLDISAVQDNKNQ